MHVDIRVVVIIVGQPVVCDRLDPGHAVALCQNPVPVGDTIFVEAAFSLKNVVIVVDVLGNCVLGQLCNAVLARRDPRRRVGAEPSVAEAQAG